MIKLFFCKWCVAYIEDKEEFVDHMGIIHNVFAVIIDHNDTLALTIR